VGRRDAGGKSLRDGGGSGYQQGEQCEDELAHWSNVPQNSNREPSDPDLGSRFRIPAKTAEILED
jgi:hypothetical protein